MNDVNKPDNQISVPKCGYYLNTIYFYLTEGCNLKCRHCWINPPFESGKEAGKFPYLDFELFKNICRQGKELGMTTAKLTGGEPLIHPDIEKIIEFINEENLALTIETNGVALSQNILDKFLKNKSPFLSISIDGVDAETHEWVRGVPGCFEAALNAARMCVKSGYHPQLIMSLMKHNAGQVEDILKLAEKENCASVKFNLVTPTERGKKLHEGGDTLPIKQLVDIGNKIESEFINKYKIKIFYSHPAAFQPLSKMYKGQLGICGIFGIIGVLGTGKYALCGIGESIPEFVFGYAEKDKLADVWNNSKVLNEIRKGLPKKLEGICGDCLNKENCLGSCIAMNYYRHKNIFAPYWYCEEAYKAGIFPEGRLKPAKYRKFIK